MPLRKRKTVLLTHIIAVSKRPYMTLRERPYIQNTKTKNYQSFIIPYIVIVSKRPYINLRKRTTVLLSHMIAVSKGPYMPLWKRTPVLLSNIIAGLKRPYMSLRERPRIQKTKPKNYWSFIILHNTRFKTAIDECKETHNHFTKPYKCRFKTAIYASTKTHTNFFSKPHNCCFKTPFYESKRTAIYKKKKQLPKGIKWSAIPLPCSSFISE